MTQTIYLDGTDQYLLVRLGAINASTGAQSILLGSAGGESLLTLIADIVVVWAEYKKDGVPIDSDITWDATTGMWKVPISDSIITQRGKAMIIISGHDESSGIDIISTVIEIQVVSKMAYKKIVPNGSYELISSSNQIILKDEYSHIGVEQVLSIRDLTKGVEMYDSRQPRKRKLFKSGLGPDITITSGVITYIEDAVLNDTDILQIVVNSE